MSLLLLKDALFEKTESRSQMLMTAVAMLVVAAILSFVAWWLISLGLVAAADAAEYSQKRDEFGRRRSESGLEQVMLLGFGGGGIVSFITLVLAFSGVFHLLRWVTGTGVAPRAQR